jgi:hypothetical protein
MSLNWILSPLTMYGAMALTLAGCLALFFSFKVEVGRVQRRGDAVKENLASQVRDMEASVGTLQQKLLEVGGRATQGTPAMNINRRVQVLHMHHRGESVETIAAALNTPRNEVELLLRVQKMMEGQSR